jgi:N6-adenosine-specific RNA methylase IME4
MAGSVAKRNGELAIPNRPTTEIAVGFNSQIRRQVDRVTDIEAIREGHRRLAAWYAYVTKREQRVELDAALRWCELRIGELLGKGERRGPGRGKKESPAGDSFSGSSVDDRYKFRLLAQHKPLVVKLIESGQVSRAKILAAIKSATFKPPADLPTGETYGVILADPPWQYDFAEADRRMIDKEYTTRTVEDICRLRVPADTNSVIYLWATAPKLREAMEVLDAWGFEYKTCAVWDKEKIGMGYWFRGQHELLLVGTRGDVSPPPAKQRVSSVIRSPRTSHSSKPVEVYELIERAFPTKSKVELFARVERPGWKSWGNEVGA